MEKTVAELFAGVGGFRVGLNDVRLENDKVFEKDTFNFVWMNQWEPSTKLQHAFECYQSRFGESKVHSNEDIAKVNKTSIPDHTLLVGGFPCQDYSVARSLSKEKGIEGKKGVLWWQINDILKVKRPPFVLLENVDRLTKSPSKQRGRDFGIMLRCFFDLGYMVEWRIINAAEYGHPQKRRRVYIIAYHKSTRAYQKLDSMNPEEIMTIGGSFASSFPILGLKDKIHNIDISKSSFIDLIDISNHFAFAFKNTGVLKGGQIYTSTSIPTLATPKTLGDIITKSPVAEDYFINSTTLEKMIYLKGGKKIERERDGHKYFYSEGSMAFPDSLDVPGRTMLTSEGTTNRSTHVVYDIVTGKPRLITPIEAERLNEFPDNWTNTGMPKKRRYFMMGNALVCGVIKKLGNELSNLINQEK